MLGKKNFLSALQQFEKISSVVSDTIQKKNWQNGVVRVTLKII